MVDRGRQPRLAQEALPEALILGELGRDQLERDRPIEPRVDRPVDDAHPAAADLSFDPITAEGRVGRDPGRLELCEHHSHARRERLHPELTRGGQRRPQQHGGALPITGLPPREQQPRQVVLRVSEPRARADPFTQLERVMEVAFGIVVPACRLGEDAEVPRNGA